MYSAYEEYEAQNNGKPLEGAPRPIEIKLTTPQRNVALSNKRFRINVAGRRSGKSYLSKFLIFQYANNNKYSKCWNVAPTYRMAKQIMWGEIKDLLNLLYFDRWEMSYIGMNKTVFLSRENL